MYTYTSPNTSKHTSIYNTMHLNTSPYASIQHHAPLYITIHPCITPCTSILHHMPLCITIHPYTKTTKDIFVCGTYIPPCNSRYFRPELFEELESDIEKFSSLGSILIMGETLTPESENTRTVFVKKVIR